MYCKIYQTLFPTFIALHKQLLSQVREDNKFGNMSGSNIQIFLILLISMLYGYSNAQIVTQSTTTVSSSLSLSRSTTTKSSTALSTASSNPARLGVDLGSLVGDFKGYCGPYCAPGMTWCFSETSYGTCWTDPQCAVPRDVPEGQVCRSNQLQPRNQARALTTTLLPTSSERENLHQTQR